MRKFLTFLVVLLFIILAPLTIYLFNLQRVLLNPDFYRLQFQKHDLYEQVIVLGAQFAVGLSQGGEGEMGPLPMTEEEIEEALREIVPPSWLERQIERNIDAFFSWLSSDEEYPALRFPMRDIKERVPEVAPRLLIQIWDRLPVCPEGVPPLGEEEPFPSCRPQGMTRDELMSEMMPQVEEGLKDFLADVPDEISLEKALREEPDEAERERLLASLNRLQRIGRLAPLISYGLIVLCAALIGLLALLAATSLRSLLGWTGSAFLIAGLMALVPALLIPFLVRGALAMALGGLGMGMIPPAATELVTGLLVDMVGAITMPIAIQSGIILIVGFLCILLAIILGLVRRPQRKATESGD
ncbi:MAG: hypothetical protein ACE5LG_00225 [Anaerolineae bacterium]